MRIIGVLTIGTMAIIIATGALVQGLPEFTAQVEQKCNLCHINPAGGGMRNSYGSQYFAQTEMAVRQVSFEEIEKFKPQVSDNISLGIDMRTQYIHDDEGRRSSFFQMEGMFYVSAQLDPEFSVTFGKGLDSGYEIFGMGYILPYQGYFKVGRFQPSYGWRFDDHTSFVRDRLGWTPGSYDTGIELGFHPQGLSAAFGVYNGAGSTFDTNEEKALSARLEYRRHIGKFGIGLGGSVFSNDSPDGSDDLYGPFWYLRAGRLIYLGEVDWRDNYGNTVSFATSQVLSYMMQQGIWLKLKYDFFDHDTGIKSGALSRYGLALQYFPIGFLEIQPNLRYYDETNAAGDSDGYLFFDGQIHFFF